MKDPPFAKPTKDGASESEEGEERRARERRKQQIPRAKDARGMTRVGIVEIDGLLVAGGVVAGLGVDVEGRESLGGAKLDFDFAPARVMNFVTRPISQNILVSQLHADF